MEESIGDRLGFTEFVAAFFGTKDIGIEGVVSKDAAAGGCVQGAVEQDMVCHVPRASWSRLLTWCDGSPRRTRWRRRGEAGLGFLDSHHLFKRWDWRRGVAARAKGVIASIGLCPV